MTAGVLRPLDRVHESTLSPSRFVESSDNRTSTSMRSMVDSSRVLFADSNDVASTTSM